MAAFKPLPLLDPAAPAPDRDVEIREITYKVLSASRKPLTLGQLMLSTAWVGMQPAATSEEVRVALFLLLGDGVLHRRSGRKWEYSLKKEDKP